MNKKFDTRRNIFTKKQGEIMKKCSEDILEFVKYVHIFHPKKGWILAGDNLYDKQKEVLKELSLNWDSKYHVVLSARQSGKSTLILLLSLWIITFSSGRVIAILAHKQKAAQGLFKRFSIMYHKLEPFFRLSQEIGDSKVELQLADGTTVFCGTTTPTGLRSESLSLLITDEFAFVPETVAEEFYYANMPTLEQMNGGYIAISTPNGKGNIFYDLYKKAKNWKDKKWGLLEIGWRDVFDRDIKWKNEKIKELSIQGKSGQEAFDREYGNSFDVLDDGVKFFDQRVLAEMKQSNLMDVYTYNDFTIDIFNDLITSNPYVVGVDLAEGKGNNFSVLAGFEINSQRNEYGEIYNLNHAFHFLESGIKIDEFFNLTFKFLIGELNDKWFMVFETNDIGRNWDMRFRYLLDELVAGTLSNKNRVFIDLLTDKFEGDTTLMVDYLSQRVFRRVDKSGDYEYGMKADVKTVPLLKSTMKRMVDDEEIIFKDGRLILEARQYEDKGGRIKPVKFDTKVGNSNYDNLAAVRTSLLPFTELSLLQTVMGLQPLTRESTIKNKASQMLDVIARVRQTTRSTDRMEAMMMIDEFEKQFGIPGTVPLSISIPDSTSGWKNRRGYFK